MKFLGSVSLIGALILLGACHGSHPAPPSRRTPIRAAVPDANGVVEKILNVTPRDQEMPYSCWATCGEMIMEFVGRVRIRQCQQASREFPTFCATCCDVNLNMDMCCSEAGLPQWRTW